MYGPSRRIHGSNIELSILTAEEEEKLQQKNGLRRQIDAAARRKSNFYHEFHSTARTFTAPFVQFNPTPATRNFTDVNFFLVSIWTRRMACNALLIGVNLKPRIPFISRDKIMRCCDGGACSSEAALLQAIMQHLQRHYLNDIHSSVQDLWTPFPHCLTHATVAATHEC